MTALRRIALLLITFIPLCTLVHVSDFARWDRNRSLMTAPDEFSYILTAQSILQGHGISTQHTLGLDTFYPPGYPLLLAAWSFVAGGLSPFTAHLLNALLLSAATAVVYLFSRRLLTLLPQHDDPRLQWGGRMNDWIALLISALFAANWHVLETALFVFSEPAFMLATFAWLALSLQWKKWHLHPLQTLAVTLLAIAAWSIRGAGLVCIIVTIAYPCLNLFQSKFQNLKSRITCILLILLLAGAYQITLAAVSREKSLLATGASGNNYTHQLINGITHGGQLRFSIPGDWPGLAKRVAYLAVTHLDDFARSFIPWLREPPDTLPRYAAGIIVALLAIVGLVRHLLRPHRTAPLLDLYIVVYFLLYLLWPFNFPRFWSPVLPIMLVFAVDAIRHFSRLRPTVAAPRAAALTLLSLLLLLATQELFLHLGQYQRRINYVSDALAAAATAIVRISPDPHHTIVAVGGDDERFVFAWYFSHIPAGNGFFPRSPQPHLLTPDGPHESLDDFLLRCLDQSDQDAPARLFLIRQFTEPDYPEVFLNLRKKFPDRMRNVRLQPIFRRGDAATVWEVLR